MLMMFDLKDNRKPFTIQEFDPIKMPFPLGLPEDTFDIKLEATPIVVKSGLELNISLGIRPFNN